jgi:large subunit ribosomal protein L4
MVVEDFSFEAPKTKDFLNIVKNLKVDGQKLLLVSESVDKNVSLSLRNVPGVRYMAAIELNTYAILNNRMLLLCEGGVEVVNSL